MLHKPADIPSDSLPLREISPAAFERFFEFALDLCVVATFSGLFLRCNQAWKTVLGWGPEELRNMTASDLEHPAEAGFVMEMGSKAVLARDGQGVSYERAMRHKDGSFRRIAWRLVADQKQRLFYGIGRPTPG